jgi:hypothetical protein
MVAVLGGSALQVPPPCQTVGGQALRDSERPAPRLPTPPHAPPAAPAPPGAGTDCHGAMDASRDIGCQPHPGVHDPRLSDRRGERARTLQIRPPAVRDAVRLPLGRRASRSLHPARCLDHRRQHATPPHGYSWEQNARRSSRYLNGQRQAHAKKTGRQQKVVPLYRSRSSRSTTKLSPPSRAGVGLSWTTSSRRRSPTWTKAAPSA